MTQCAASITYCGKTIGALEHRKLVFEKNKLEKPIYSIYICSVRVQILAAVRLTYKGGGSECVWLVSRVVLAWSTELMEGS